MAAECIFADLNSISNIFPDLPPEQTVELTSPWKQGMRMEGVLIPRRKTELWLPVERWVMLDAKNNHGLLRMVLRTSNNLITLLD